MTIAAKNPTFPFNFEITRSKRKTLVIYVKSGKVDIRSPLKASKVWVHEFIQEKTPWILDQLKEQERKLSERLVIADNQQVSFFGTPRTIQVILSTRQKVQLVDDKLFIYTKENTPKRLEKLFNAWLQDQAREYMGSQTIKTARILGVENKLQEVVYRKTRTKWGHCCQDGTIQYNWLTMMAPRDVVNYLIIHETSHLRHLNHSKRFWDTVASICPDYKNLRNWLAENGHRFWTA